MGEPAEKIDRSIEIDRAITAIPEIAKLLRVETRSEMDRCYTCWTCSTECPGYVFGNRLNPTRLVRMAHYGLMDELMEGPEIWYCLSCNRCSNMCPMTVRPSNLIGYLRKESVRRKIVKPEMVSGLSDLHRQFHHVRWHVLSTCLKGETPSNLAAKWDMLKDAPIKTASFSEVNLNSLPNRSDFRKASDHYIGIPTDLKVCFTCYECSNACPVCYEQPVFNPLFLFRLTTLGLQEEALTSPSLWLCLGCQSCTHACSQRVKGHLIIRHLQDIAVEQGYVKGTSLQTWKKAQKELYPLLFDRIESLWTEVTSTRVS
ncbi:MAG: 4Fe-4S dicluster domain-containing protein [Pseudomonadota bacterium]